MLPSFSVEWVSKHTFFHVKILRIKVEFVASLFTKPKQNKIKQNKKLTHKETKQKQTPAPSHPKEKNKKKKPQPTTISFLEYTKVFIVEVFCWEDIIFK